MKFLSASSAREDDALLDNAADNIKISIRVLREGGRPFNPVNILHWLKFLSASSAREDDAAS